MSEFPELGFYALAGEADSSRDLLQEVRDGEAPSARTRSSSRAAASTR